MTRVPRNNFTKHAHAMRKNPVIIEGESDLVAENEEVDEAEQISEEPEMPDEAAEHVAETISE